MPLPQQLALTVHAADHCLNLIQLAASTSLLLMILVDYGVNILILFHWNSSVYIYPVVVSLRASSMLVCQPFCVNVLKVWLIFRCFHYLIFVEQRGFATSRL